MREFGPCCRRGRVTMTTMLTAAAAVAKALEQALLERKPAAKWRSTTFTICCRDDKAESSKSQMVQFSRQIRQSHPDLLACHRNGEHEPWQQSNVRARQQAQYRVRTVIELLGHIAAVANQGLVRIGQGLQEWPIAAVKLHRIGFPLGAERVSISNERNDLTAESKAHRTLQLNLTSSLS